jgi:hypothetical protein
VVVAWEISGGSDEAECVTVMTVGGQAFRFEIGTTEAGKPKMGVKVAMALTFVSEREVVVIVDGTTIHVLPLL